MRQVAANYPAARPASRARARSPASAATGASGAAPVAQSTRQSQAAAYGFQSPLASRGGGAGSGGAPAASRGSSGSVEFNVLLSGGTGGTASRSAARGGCPVGPSGGCGSGDPPAGRAARSNRLAVVVRKRPMNRRELQAGQHDVVLCKHNSVLVREPKLKVDLTRYVEEHNFLFDQSFDETITNEQLYSSCVRPIIDAVFNRAKCTCFAYGQTGSGKTFTMMGPPKRQGEGFTDRDRTPGIFVLAAQDIFGTLRSEEHSHLAVYIAFYEIYCGKLFDLLNNRQILQARENAKSNVVIVGLQEIAVENVQELMEVMEFGLTSRTTGVTGANADSSRSHAILQISLKDLRSKEDGGDGRLKEHGKISFIDLAGSERGADTLDTDRQTRMDGAEINKSLLALKECIRALDQQLDHTPFRGSKLTQVLKDSFVGSNCRTVMIANVSPCSSAVEHSLNTLRYAYRVKELRRSPGANLTTGDGTGDGNAPADVQNDVPVEEESSDECGGDAEAHPHATQQLRASHLPTASQKASNQQDVRQFEPPVRTGSGAHAQQQLEEPAVGPRYVGSATSGSCGASKSSGSAGANSIAQSGGVQTTNWSAHAAGSSQELAPDVALETGGGSQAALDELARQHDKLIGTILAEEEELITAHRAHIDLMVELIKEEMTHLNNVDRPGSDVDAYVAGLDRILQLKAQHIGEIRGRVDVFKEHLQQEDSISRKFQSLASSSSS